MNHTEPVTRDKERTRKAILEATSVMIAAHGRGVSLADIAQQAGVSKGALTHHFPSRLDLERALFADAAERLRAEVYAQVDLSENRPGKLLRAYIRAMTSDSILVRELLSPTSFLASLGTDLAMGQAMEEDAEFWRKAFEQDGMDAATSLALRLAAESVGATADTPYLTRDEFVAVRERLLALAEG